MARMLLIIDNNYPNQIKNAEVTVDSWFEILQQYDPDEVLQELKTIMADSRYQMKMPTCYYLVKNLKPIKDKINWNETVFYCDVCNKAFNNLEVQKKHRERCSSIRYIASQYKKWFYKEVDKKELYNMPSEEFDKKYNELLKFLMNKTTDEKEKTRINFIFNVPTPETAKEFLKS